MQTPPGNRELQRLQHDIDTLKESIRLDWVDMASRPMSPAERGALRTHIGFLIRELENLLRRLDESARITG